MWPPEKLSSQQFGWKRHSKDGGLGRGGAYNLAMRITQAQTDQLLRHGYAIVPRFLSADEVSAAMENLLQYVPTPQELAATPQRYAWVYDEAEHLQTEFPFAGDALNHVSTHPAII